MGCCVLAVAWARPIVAVSRVGFVAVRMAVGARALWAGCVGRLLGVLYGSVGAVRGDVSFVYEGVLDRDLGYRDCSTLSVYRTDRPRHITID